MYIYIKYTYCWEDKMLNMCTLLHSTHCTLYYIQELDLDQWIVTRDSDWGEGYSSAELTHNSAGTAAIFHGELSTRVPADGRTEEAGRVKDFFITSLIMCAL